MNTKTTSTVMSYFIKWLAYNSNDNRDIREEDQGEKEKVYKVKCQPADDCTRRKILRER